MHVHLPKPLHGWREFLGEVGIIVVGVLIALSAEQLIESLHWRHKVEAVQEAIADELTEDDLPQAYARVVIGHCLAQQLDSLRALAKPGADGMIYLRQAAFYAPPIRSWDTSGANLADRSDLAAHLSTAQLNAIEAPYRYVSRMDALAGDEKAGLLALQRSRYGVGRLSLQDATEISDAIDLLQFSNRASAGAAYALLQVARDAPGGGLPDEQKRRVLAQAHEVYGKCVIEFVPPAAAYGGRQVSKPTGLNLFRGI